MEKVRFTVAISAYNIENYVKRAIDSVLNQTYKVLSSHFPLNRR